MTQKADPHLLYAIAAEVKCHPTLLRRILAGHVQTPKGARYSPVRARAVRALREAGFLPAEVRS